MDAPLESGALFQTNGREYRLPAVPIVAICLDGSGDEYLDAALLAGRTPNLRQLCLSGVRAQARAAMPTFTNVNNASIVTGAAPSAHGISGNFFYDAEHDREIMMNSAEYLRAETILSTVARAGRKVAVVTAKEKLRDILAHNLVSAGGIAFSSEKAGQVTLATHGIENAEQLMRAPAPAIYSAEASLYVLRVGVALLREKRADFLYLSTTDFIQHKAAPDESEALEFYAAIDRELGEFVSLGAVIGVTADHGMNAKQKPDGSPNVIFLESALTDAFGPGFRVILPITDPYVVHHGALGSFACVHVSSSISRSKVRQFLFEMPGVTEVLLREEASRKLELPSDRIGDLVVCSGRDVVLGRTPAYHDLSVLTGPLRSHGGRYEELVPFIFSHPLTPEYRQRAFCDPRNFDLFDFLLNGLQLNSVA